MGIITREIFEQPMYPIALVIRGRVGYAYIFRRRKGHQEIMRYYYPYNPKTPEQQANRQKFAQSVTNWKSFDPETKKYYHTLKNPKSMSGMNRYIYYYMRS